MAAVEAKASVRSRVWQQPPRLMKPVPDSTAAEPQASICSCDCLYGGVHDIRRPTRAKRGASKPEIPSRSFVLWVLPCFEPLKSTRGPSAPGRQGAEGCRYAVCTAPGQTQRGRPRARRGSSTKAQRLVEVRDVFPTCQQIPVEPRQTSSRSGPAGTSFRP